MTHWSARIARFVVVLCVDLAIGHVADATGEGATGIERDRKKRERSARRHARLTTMKTKQEIGRCEVETVGKWTRRVLTGVAFLLMRHSSTHRDAGALLPSAS